jgi:hypothetical protein
VLVAQLQIHERLVVTLVLLQLVLLQLVLLQLVLLQLVQVVQQVLAQLLVVAPLELEVHPCLLMIGEQKMFVLQENLAYLF